MLIKIISELVARFAPKGRWKFTNHDGYWYNECPICGCKTENHDGSPPDFNFYPYCGGKSHYHIHDRIGIECDDCGLGLACIYETKEQAAAVWNRRGCIKND